MATGAFGSTDVQSADLDPDMLLSLQFGPKVNESSQRRIIHFVRRVLYPEDAFSTDNSYDMRRKRRRKDDRYASDHYSDSDPDDKPDRRRTRQIESNNDRYYVKNKSKDASPERANSVRTVTFYSDAAGFDLDSTQFDARDTIRFEHGTKAIVGLTNDQAQELGNPCFNCSMPGHEVRDCPMPQDQDRIQANRDAFKEKGSGQFSSRFYLEVENEKRVQTMREMFQPGQPLSQALQEALGLQYDDDIPEYIDRMYIHGYPPAYIGTESNQDPLCARKLPISSIPSTPNLHIYSNAEDYDIAHKSNISTTNSNSDQQPGDDSDNSKSDEEGAITDEEGVIDDKEAEESLNKQNYTNGSQPICKIPLVTYPGLDLRRFDFSSGDRPGRPFHVHTPLAYREFMDAYYATHTGNYKYPEYSLAYNDDYYSESRQRIRREHDYYSRSPVLGSSAGRNDGSWDGLLESYYRSAAGNYAAADEYGEYRIYRNHAVDPSFQQPESIHNSTAKSSNVISLNSATAPNSDDSDELEDGECDMELSE
ncbi:hypothetical protein IWW36_000021 [Coemansia brasiliensis]|uniref:CCHC-type domain-containing protein n=1 Tax=Coemansia brasiliensis TaxID=2650707 RepID=A0A9W8IGG3_9FUNG|nr:hypothetical protein IWW36_000021 [Coemansia brasiliensis]